MVNKKIIHCSMLHCSAAASVGSPCATQLAEVLCELSASLGHRSCCLGDVVFVHLFLADLKDFAECNAEYAKWFDKDSTVLPSRSCVEVGQWLACLRDLSLTT